MNENQRLSNQLCFPLYAATRAMTQAYQPLLTPFGLTYPQYLVLLVLWETNGLAVKHIGERLQLDSGTLTPLLKRLEAAGLVRRVRSGEDERVVKIWLTPEGATLQERLAEIPGTLLAASGLEPSFLLRLRDDLNHFIRHLRASQGHSPD